MLQRREGLLTDWVDLVGDLLSGPPGPFPVDLLLRELQATFGVNASWNWMDGDGSFGFSLYEPVPGWPDPDQMAGWGGGEMAEHPLVHWFAVTGRTTAMTLGRVPRQLSSRQASARVREQLQPFGLEQQLSVPYRQSAVGHRAFVMATTGRDFSDEDLLLARRLQPLLVLLARQTAVLGDAPCEGPHESARSTGVTARELAVLRLLGDGLTAEAIGRELRISVRTVHVHLGRLYHKLEVHDRLMAVQVARTVGLLDTAPDLRATNGATPGARQAALPADRTYAWRPGAGVLHEAGVP